MVRGGWCKGKGSCDLLSTQECHFHCPVQRTGRFQGLVDVVSQVTQQPLVVAESTSASEYQGTIFSKHLPNEECDRGYPLAPALVSSSP